MITLDCEQGSEEWLAVRMGVPSASNFRKLLPSNMKLSTQAPGYRHTLLAELLGVRAELYQNDAMKRGTELEPEARETYEFVTGATVEQVGFCLRDDGRIGCSPDGLIGEDGGLEIKCPMAHTHVAYLLRGECPHDYYPQVQGAMYVCGPGRQWWDFMSYYPGLPPMIVRVERDDEYISALKDALYVFLLKLDNEYDQLKRG